MKLNQYSKKRDFSVTSEPKPLMQKKSQSRFVIQYHQARAKHYDLRLEHEGVLISFAVPKGLPKTKATKRLAVHVEDHPVSYINFEGVIPKGQYGAGIVKIFDKGTYVPLLNFKTGLKQGKLKFFLQGEKYVGVWTLVKKDDKNWFLLKCDDKYFAIYKPSKVLKNPFSSVQVQLCEQSDKIPQKDDYLFEIKYDGYRIVTFCNDKKTVLKTRNMEDYSDKFQNIKDEINKNFKNQSFVLDGEVVSFNKDGKSDFSLLQKNIKNKTANFHYVVFDILALNGTDLRNLPLLQRKKILKDFLKDKSSQIIYSEHIIGNGEKCFDMAKRNNLEGIIAKKIDSKYIGKRTCDWIKIKCYKRQEFVIGGYLKSNNTEYFSSLLVGYYKNKKLIFAGKVGTGFSEKLKAEIFAIFKKQNNSPFEKKINNAFYVKPNLIAEIKFAEFTSQNVLRQASFISLRIDKKATQIIREY